MLYILKWPKSPGGNAEVDNFFQEPIGSLMPFSIGRFLVHFFVYMSKNRKMLFHWANIPGGVKSKSSF